MVRRFVAWVLLALMALSPSSAFAQLPLRESAFENPGNPSAPARALLMQRAWDVLQ